MTLTKGQGHRSRSNVQKLAKIYKMGHISDARMLFPLQTSYLVPRYNPIRRIQWPKCRWPWPSVKVKGQGQIFPKMHKKQRTGHILEATSPTNFILGTKVQPNKTQSMTQVPMILTQGQGQIFSKMHKKTKNWSYLGGYFTYRLHTWYQDTSQ